MDGFLGAYFRVTADSSLEKNASRLKIAESYPESNVPPFPKQRMV